MDGPCLDEVLVLAPGRPEAIVSLRWEAPVSNGLTITRCLDDLATMKKRLLPAGNIFVVLVPPPPPTLLPLQNYRYVADLASSGAAAPASWRPRDSDRTRVGTSRPMRRAKGFAAARPSNDAVNTARLGLSAAFDGLL